MRYQWEDHPNRNMSTIHVDARLPIIRGGCAPMRFLPGSPHPHQPTADAIVSIPGVEGVSMAYHAAIITKGTVFGWDEILPAVLEIIRDAFDPGGDLVEVGGEPAPTIGPASDGLSPVNLPCPFCGVLAIDIRPRDEDGAVVPDDALTDLHRHVECDHCGANGPSADTHGEAVAAWNRRAGEATDRGGRP